MLHFIRLEFMVVIKVSSFVYIPACKSDMEDDIKNYSLNDCQVVLKLVHFKEILELLQEQGSSQECD